MTERERQVRHLVLTAVDECAVCGHTYAADNLAVIGNRGDLWVLALRCPQCRKQGFIAALVNSGQELPAIMPLDAHEEELRRFTQGEPVSARDVLEMHEFLKRHNGGLTRYLGEENRADG